MNHWTNLMLAPDIILSCAAKKKKTLSPFQCYIFNYMDNCLRLIMRPHYDPDSETSYWLSLPTQARLNHQLPSTISVRMPASKVLNCYKEFFSAEPSAHIENIHE